MVIHMKELKHYGLAIHENERDELRRLCDREGIDLVYLDLFSPDEPFHMLWSFSSASIGLTSTVCIRGMGSKGQKALDLERMKELFETDEWKQQKLYSVILSRTLLVEKRKEDTFEDYIVVCVSLSKLFEFECIKDKGYFKSKSGFYTIGSEFKGISEFGVKCCVWSKHYKRYSLIQVKQLLLSDGNKLKLPKLTTKVAKEIDENHKRFLEKRENK